MNRMMNLEFMCCVLYGMKHINIRKFKKNKKHKDTVSYSHSILSVLNKTSISEEDK